MPPIEVDGNNPLDGPAGPDPLHEEGFDAGNLASGKSVASIENLTLVENDGVQ
jgi:hypothetical protein